MGANSPDDRVAVEAWQIAETEAGLAEADRGEFATADDLSRVVTKYAPPAGPASNSGSQSGSQSG